ncbi:MAG: NlpC/P60 family protein [Rhodothermales bacterium]
MPSSRPFNHSRHTRVVGTESLGIHGVRVDAVGTNTVGADAVAYMLARLTVLPTGLWRAFPALLGAVVLLTGCTSSRVPATTSYPTSHEIEAAPDSAVEPALRRLVARWEGTPHVLGGMSESGMDCSAFVQRVFADAFQFDLPRTTEEQVEEGRRVNMSELQAGDLVFFQPPTKTNHVGIYLNDGEFAHVSTTAGVMVSDIELPYWRGSYWTSRRVLAGDLPALAQPVTEDRGTPERPRDRTRRVGW